MPKALYYCKYCQICYEEEHEALVCESKHCNIEDISNFFYNSKSKFPYKFDVKLSDGNVYTYHIVPTRMMENEDE